MEKRYIMYLRKSTESDDRQQLSIPAQEDALQRLVADMNLVLHGDPIRESQSAKRPGRPGFDQMMAAVETGEVHGIVCWHLDRLARNLLDAARVVTALENGLMHEIVTPHGRFTSTPELKFLMTINFGMASKYSDDLSVNIKRGNEAALKRGRWPSKPKTGYIRDPKTGDILPDPERFELVQKMWRLRLSGMPVTDIVDLANNQWGFRTSRRGKSGGGPLSTTQAYVMFSEPFYAGVMRFKGKTYEGNHVPMVTWSEYEDVQALSRQHLARPKTVGLPYRGLMRCGACGAGVTGEKKTQRHGHKYVYYHCATKGQHGKYCPEKSIEQRELERQFVAFLESLEVPEALLNAMNEEAPRMDKLESADVAEQDARLEGLVNASMKRVDRLRRLCADDVITTEAFVQDREAELAAQRRHREKQKTLRRTGRFEPLMRDLSFVNRAKSVFERAGADDRRGVVRKLVSNLTLEGQKLLILAKQPFARLAEIASNPARWSKRSDVRKLLLECAHYSSGSSDMSRPSGFNRGPAPGEAGLGVLGVDDDDL